MVKFSLRASLVLALTASALAASTAAHAGLVVVTVTGTVTGTDAYNNSVYFGANTGNSGSAGNLNGMTGSISITYDSAMWVDTVPGGSPIYYTGWHQPAYPYFYGQVGSNPVRSASFTVNGKTIALDVAGPGEVGTLQVENWGNVAPAQTGRDAFTLRGGDNRTTWCPNDGQCAEGVGINAYGGYYQELFDANGFQTDDEYVWTNTNGTVLGGSVRMYENRLCLAGSGWPGADGLCPAGRFDDYALYPNTVHWVDFQLSGTRLTIMRLPDGSGPSGGNGVPEPGTLALLAAAGVGLITTSRRRNG